MTTALVLLALGYAGICAYLFFVQRSMIYFPTTGVNGTDATLLVFDTGEARINVWRTGDVRPHAILYFGGNAEEVSQNIDNFRTAFPDFTTYLFSYRGYSGSSGTPTEKGIYHDALQVFDELAATHDAIAVIGRSLGSGVATRVATERDVSKLVLVTPFDSIASVAQAHFRWLPVSALIKDRFDSRSRADRIACPTLVLAASHDEIIPRRHTDALVKAITQAPLAVTRIDNTTHNTIGEAPEYLAAIAQFLRQQRRP